jgi:glycosyltransferase involved in cell wall biosynthesis
MKMVSIIIPCRNEEKYIGKCLDSIIAQDYPNDKLEVLIVDGMSEDRTREIVTKRSKKHLFIVLLDNFLKIVPPALNIGIKQARGDIIIRMDAHSIYEKDYISKCVRCLKEYNADNIGGVCVTVPGGNATVSEAIAIVLSSAFGVGNAYFRTGLKEPRYVDTVPFGCYKKKVFEKIGLFNENLVRNQDIEFNLRLKKAGGKILLAPDIVSYYHARSTLSALAKNNFLNGLWVIYSTRFAKMPFSLRHLIPFFFVMSLAGSLILSLFYDLFIYLFTFIIGLYSIVNVFFSIKLSLKNGLKYFPALIFSFFTLHFSYGLGSIWGLVKLLMPEKREVK